MGNNLPQVHNVDKWVIFTPCDFFVPTNGIKPETISNTEMKLIADVNLKLLTELHLSASIKSLLDRGKYLYEFRKID